MAYDFSILKAKISDIEKWLKKEFFSIRTGRATPSILDSIRVDSYGAKLPIVQVANVGVEDNRTLRIVPYDASVGKEIEKAIVASNLGLSVSSDDRGVRVSFPELTSENRSALAKVVKEKLEQARISLRGERDNMWSDIQKQEKEGGMAEDDKFRYKEEMQKLIDEGNSNLELLVDKKEREILDK